MGISQSGQSPDIVSVLAEGKRQGCLTLAITNEIDSPLAQTADLYLDVEAGSEKAVAATKTYTAQLTSIAMLSAALLNDEKRWQELERLPGWVETVLQLDKELEQISLRYRYMQRCVVLGRGFNYATAFEWSLKLKELTYVEAEPYSSADFMHGPIAMVDQGFPVMVVNPSGMVYDSILELMGDLKHKQHGRTGSHIRPKRSPGHGAGSHPTASRHSRVVKPDRIHHSGAVVWLPPDPSPRFKYRSATRHPQGDRNKLII